MVSTLFLALLAPFLPILWLLNRMDDSGPVFFRQQRLGKDRRPFSILKLRTMQEEQVTRLGSRLRPTGIDELAQFYNVLKGEMTLIGPRPVTESDALRFGWGAEDPRWKLRPGMTGLPGILGTRRSQNALRLERFHAKHHSVSFDFQLLCVTFGMVFFGKTLVRIWIKQWRKHFGAIRAKTRPQRARSLQSLNREIREAR